MQKHTTSTTPLASGTAGRSPSSNVPHASGVPKGCTGAFSWRSTARHGWGGGAERRLRQGCPTAVALTRCAPRHTHAGRCDWMPQSIREGQGKGGATTTGPDATPPQLYVKTLGGVQPGVGGGGVWPGSGGRPARGEGGEVRVGVRVRVRVRGWGVSHTGTGPGRPPGGQGG